MAYTYNRADGGTTKCYGEIKVDSSFFICCENEMDDGHVEDLEGETHNTWEKVCRYLENNGYTKVEQIETD